MDKAFEPTHPLVSEFSDSFVEYPPLDTILKDLHRLRKISGRSGFKPSIMITGDAGVGKTSLIRHFEQYCKDVGGPKVLRIDVRPSWHETLQLIYKTLTGSKNTRGLMRASADGLFSVVVDELKNHHVGMLIINEAQQLFEITTTSKRLDIDNQLKNISDLADLCIVFVGMPWSIELLKDQQWLSRVKRIHSIPLFKIQNAEKMEKKAFKTCLEELSKALPLQEPPLLQDKSFSARLFAYSKGEMRALKFVLSEGLSLALESGSRTLTFEHLFEATKLEFEDSVNPFNPNLTNIDIEQVSRYTTLKKDPKTGEVIRTNREYELLKNVPLSQLMTK